MFDSSTPAGKNKAGRMARRKRRKRIGNVVLIILFVSVIIFGFMWAIKTPALAIQNINVEGVISCQSNEIISSSDICIGDNLLKILISDISGAKKKLIDKYGFIKKIKVKISLDRNVLFEITEREPVARMYVDNEIFYIDEDYILYKNAGNKKNTDLIDISGLNALCDKESEDLKENNLRKLDAWERLIYEINSVDVARTTNLGNLITGIDLTSPDRPKVTVESRIIVDFGGFDDFDIKIPLLTEALKLNLARQSGYFNFMDSRTGRFIPE